MNDPVTIHAISEYKRRAENYFKTLKRNVPSFNSKWCVNEHTKTYLDKMAHIIKQQLENQEGILILEGEAGSGKNVLIDIFGHFTNRETHTFSCNFQTEKDDVTYAFHFDPKKGTYHLDSKLIEALQTPGSIVNLDEINTLPPGVTKMFNPLLDYRRELYLVDGRVIKVHPSVIITGTMNPQSYLGVTALSKEVKSRSRILNVGYPSESHNGKRSPFEAEYLAKRHDDLLHLAQEQFYLAWDYIINNVKNNGADRFTDKKITQAINDIAIIVRVANKVRSAYEAFQTSTSNDTVEFVFCLRTDNQIVDELEAGTQVRDAIKEVVLPKINDADEKKRVKILIENA